MRPSGVRSPQTPYDARVQRLTFKVRRDGQWDGHAVQSMSMSLSNFWRAIFAVGHCRLAADCERPPTPELELEVRRNG